jgi:hypothetical protein
MATSIRKEAIPDGGFGALPMAEDYVFNAGIAHKWHVKNVDAVLTRVRRRPTGLTSTRPVLMEKCVRIVVANELRRLGIVCTDREMSVHRFLGVHSGEPFGITLDEVHEWLKKLERGNRESATHDVREFRRVLSVEWYQGCLSLSRLGLRVCDQYMRSPFARAGDVGIVDRLRLVAKCAIRHRRRA